MATVSYDEYEHDLKKFLASHKGDWKVETSPMMENRWYKKYYFLSGGFHEFIEINDYVEESVEFTGMAHGIQFVRTANVKFIRTEYYSSDNSTSKYVYEVVS